jgi:hypothetical protein
MKRRVIFLIALFALTGQAPGAPNKWELVYEFGYNTAAAKSGPGTGTTTIQIMGGASDGGVMIGGTDNWWNSARPRATNLCELYPNGTVDCAQRPYAISPIQLTIFPLLARDFFNGLGNGSSGWERSYQVKAAIIPGASGMAGNPYTWNCVFNLHGKGQIPNAGSAVLIETTGTLTQQGGHYLKGTSKQRIAYDPVSKVPVAIRDVRTHLPQRTVYNNDFIELKLMKDSRHSK